MKYNWEFERSIHSVRLMVDYAVSQQMTYSSILQNTGLKKQQLLDPNILISAHQELQVICNLVDALQDQPMIGLDIGALYHFTTFGSLGMALMSSANIREALDLALQYFQLTFLFTTVKVVNNEVGVYLHFSIEGVPDKVKRFILERDMLALITVQRDLVSENFCQEVAFSFEASNRQNYHKYFSLEPRFDAAGNYILIPLNKADANLQMSNQLILNTAEQQCRHQLSQRKQIKQYTSQVQELLMSMQGDVPSMEIVAARMHLNVRTLRRYLANEQSTFLQIREEVRRILAEQYLLRSHLSIENIAEWLGYAEPSSFIHAYKRWYGKTPHMTRRARIIRLIDTKS